MLNDPQVSVSVIIPAYNREQFVGEAICSVLAQTRCPDEIVVVDDGSGDRTCEIANSFGGIVRCVRQENRGVSEARNTGVREAQGDVLAFLDSDDLWLPQKLEKQMAHLVTHPETEIVFTHMQAFLSPEVATTWNRTLHTGIVPSMCTSSMAVRASAFARIGGFDPEQKVSEFIEWFSRAQDLGCRVHVLADLLVKRRVHASNTVLTRKDMNSQYAQVLKKILERRRAAQGPDHIASL